jgi:hypothetical protein
MDQITNEVKEAISLQLSKDIDLLAATVVGIVVESMNGSHVPPIAVWPWKEAPEQLQKIAPAWMQHGGWVILATKGCKKTLNEVPISTGTRFHHLQNLSNGSAILFLGISH